MTEKNAVLIDCANWLDITLRCQPITITEAMVKYVYDGEIYFTRGELFVAQMLDLQLISAKAHMLIEFMGPDQVLPAKLPRKMKKSCKSKGERLTALTTLKPRVKRGTCWSFEPDFLFGRQDDESHPALVWTNPDGSQEVIHGFECKGTKPKAGNRRYRKVGDLYKARGINLKVLTEAEILSYAAQGLRLPLSPLPTP